MSVDDSLPRVGYNNMLRAEADAVLSKQLFRRSPVLSKLLRYLIEETANGRADKLKSFVVATEALGRPDSFDAASDSSARVQMVRLRKTLESHYAQHGPLAELCIYLQPGSYSVRLGKLAVAYPMLYRPLSDASVKLGQSALSNADAAANAELANISSPMPARRHNWLFSIGILAGIGLAILAWSTWQKVASSRISTDSPILELQPVDSAETPELIRVSRLVSSTFADNLPRFKISRVRLVDSVAATQIPNSAENVYRLSSRLEDDMDGGQKLFVNLIDTHTDTALWSREVALMKGRSPSATLVPLLAEINGPFGVIASHGSTLYKDSDSGGYPCLLKYFEFAQTREPEIEVRVADCFEKPVKEIRLQATLLAARAFFAIERRDASRDFPAASRQAIGFARAAVSADPNDGSANFALARMSYLREDCVSARFYTTRALETNSGSPMITATLAALANVCDYPDAGALLDRAFLAQSPRFAKGRLLLTLAALAQNRPDMISQLEHSDLPQSRYNRVNYYLAEALIAASQGRRADAARNWIQFSQNIPAGSVTPDEKLRSLVALPKMRAKVIALLDKGGAFEREAKK